jgi:hypothetical protein
MRVVELGPAQGKHLVRNRWGYPTEIATWLQRNGFVELAPSGSDHEGAFSRVFSSPTSKAVVKIATESDIGWLSFARFAQQHWRQNPHLPKITRIITYEPEAEMMDFWNPDNGPLFLSFMERLRPIPKDMFYHDDELTGLRSFCFIRLNCYDPQIEPRARGEDRRYFVEMADEWQATHKPFADLMLHLAAIKPANCDFDLHALNFMLRGGTVVVTDPFRPA